MVNHLKDLAEVAAAGNTDPDRLAEAAQRALNGKAPFPSLDELLDEIATELEAARQHHLQEPDDRNMQAAVTNAASKLGHLAERVREGAV